MVQPVLPPAGERGAEKGSQEYPGGKVEMVCIDLETIVIDKEVVNTYCVSL